MCLSSYLGTELSCAMTEMNMLFFYIVICTWRYVAIEIKLHHLGMTPLAIHYAVFNCINVCIFVTSAFKGFPHFRKIDAFTGCVGKSNLEFTSEVCDFWRLTSVSYPLVFDCFHCFRQFWPHRLSKYNEK